MLTATMLGPIVSLDALAGGGTSEGSNTSATRARSSIHESVRCGAAGNVDKALDRGLEAYREEGAPVELRLEAAKLCIDWCAALGYLERCHPLILMMRNSEAYWFAILGQHDMAIRKFSALLADMKHCPGLDPDISIAIRNNSAMPWKYTGKWKKAARVYRELLSELEEQREESDMTLLTVRDNLAEVLSADRCYDEAIALYERNMDALLTVADHGDWRVLRLRNEIARNTWMGGDRDAGEDLWTVLAEDCRRYLGDRDPMTARIRTILLTLATLRGDEGRAMSIARKLRDDHPDDWEECDFSVAAALLAEAERGESGGGEGGEK